MPVGPSCASRRLHPSVPAKGSAEISKQLQAKEVHIQVDPPTKASGLETFRRWGFQSGSDRPTSVSESGRPTIEYVSTRMLRTNSGCLIIDSFLGPLHPDGVFGSDASSMTRFILAGAVTGGEVADSRGQRLMPRGNRQQPPT